MHLQMDEKLASFTKGERRQWKLHWTELSCMTKARTISQLLLVIYNSQNYKIAQRQGKASEPLWNQSQVTWKNVL